MKLLKKFEFKGYELGAYLTQYTNNNRPAIILVDMEDGIQYAVATINLPESSIPDNHVIIKNYGENVGILEKLIAEGIVSEPINIVQTGFVTVPICKLLVS